MSLRLFALFFALWASITHADVVNVPRHLNWSASVADTIFIFEDPSGRLTLNDVLALPSDGRGFRQSSALLSNIGLTRSAIWLRLDVANISAHEQWLRLALGPFNFEQQDSYIQHNGQWERLAAGLNRPMPAAPQASRMPTVRIVLPSQAQKRIYIRLQTQKAFHLQPKLYTANAYQQMESHTQLWDGILFGGLLAFGWGALMVAFFARSASFSLLGLLCVIVFIYESSLRGYGKFYGWPLGADLGLAGIQFFGYLSYIMTMLFCLHVAKVEQLAIPKRIMYAIAVFAGMMAIGPFIVDAFVINQIAIYATPARALILLMVALYLMKQLAPSRKLILFQAAFSLLIVILRALDSLGYLADFNAAAGIEAIAITPVLAIMALFINLTIIAGWIHHIARQRKIATDKLLLWQEQEQTRLREEVAKQTEALRRAVLYADEKNRQKTEILSYVGHDLRAPLATISGYVKLLNANKESRNSASIQAIERSIDYQMTLIDELLKYAKTELKPPSLSPAPVYTKILLDDIAHHAQALAQKKNNRLHFEVSPVLPELLLLDSKRLRQVLLNLLANAAKFTCNGEIHVRANANALRDSEIWSIRFAVTDTGIGIEDDKKAAIFKAFEQIIPLEQGVGLGLFIAQNIVREMGGQLELQSVPQHGSTFSFEIQLRSLNDNVVNWMPPSAAPSPDTAANAGTAMAHTADPSGVPPSNHRMELALMARDGHVTDIENWLNEMLHQYPKCRHFFDEIKAALYSLDMAKIESLALAQNRQNSP